MSRRSLNIAVVGVQSRRGRCFLKSLEKNPLPIGFLRPLVEGSVGNRLLSFRNADYAIDVASPLSFRGCDVVFFLGLPEATLRFCEAAVRAGCLCIDGSSAYAASSLYRLLVPEVNAQMLRVDERVFIAPEPATLALVHLLYPLHTRLGLQEIRAVYLQGVLAEEEQKELLFQYREVLAHPEEGHHRFTQVFNIVPALGEIRGKGETSVERQVALQVQRIFSYPELRVQVTGAKVPVLGASSFFVDLRAKRGMSLEELKTVLQAIPRASLVEGPGELPWPTPKSAAERKRLEVGRLRSDPESGHISFFLTGDEMQLGFAQNVVDIAVLLSQGVPSHV